MDEIPQEPYKFDAPARQRFLDALAKYGTITKAAEAAWISVSYIYQRRKIDEELAKDMEESMETYRQTIADEIHRRAVEGVVEHKYHQGDPILEPVLDDDGVPIMEQLLDSEQNPIFDKHGRPVFRPKVKGHAYVRHFSDSLLTLHARRHIPEYNEKKSVDMRVAGLSDVLNEIKNSTGLPSAEERPDE